MSTDQQVRDAIRALGETGADPDVDAAWRRVEPRLDERRAPTAPRAGRGAMALAAAAALVAVILLVGRPDDDGAVELDSAGDPDGGTPAPDTDRAPGPEGSTEAAVGTPVTFPADAIVVSAPEHRALYVLDAVTGDMAGLIGGPPGGYTIPAGAVTAAGDVWFVAQTDDGPRLGRTRWDGVDEHELLAPNVSMADADLGNIAVDPAGQWVAASAMDRDGTCRLAVHTPATGQWRAMRWAEGDPRGSYRCPAELSSSADGSQLAFLNTHDSDGTETFEAYVVDLDAGSLTEARLLSDEAWDVAFDPAGGLLALVGPTRGAATVRYLGGGPDVGVPPLDDVVDLRASLGSVVVRLESGWVRLDSERDAWVPTPLARWTGS